MKLGIGADHGGFELKEVIKRYLVELGHEVIDFGTNTLESVDYPDYGYLVAKSVVSNEVEKGIVICGSGIGISIAANKVNGIRCALVYDSYCAKLTAMHNNTNMLALGGRIIGIDLAKEIVNVWLSTEFEGGRHINRIEKIKKLEEREEE